MVISLTGAQSTGKSTLLKALKADQRYKGYKFIPEVTRVIKRKYDLNINEEGDNLTQLAILGSHFDNYLKFKNTDVIMDRCILDGLVYTTHQYFNHKIDPGTILYCEYLFELLVRKIDIIFYTDPSMPLVDDGERSINIEFRNKIVNLFEVAIKHYRLDVVRLKGTVEERLETIHTKIKNYVKK